MLPLVTCSTMRALSMIVSAEAVLTLLKQSVLAAQVCCSQAASYSHLNAGQDLLLRLAYLLKHLQPQQGVTQLLLRTLHM